MQSELSSLSIRSSGHPALRILASFPIACFTCALFTDIAYALSASMMWADFSAWLLAVGMVGGVLAALAGIVVLILERRIGPRRPVGRIALGGLLCSPSASSTIWCTAGTPGRRSCRWAALSGVTVLVMLITVWVASGATYRREVVVPYSGARP